MSISELEFQVENLPPEDLDRFTKWFEQFIASRWDGQIEKDVAAGRLDHLAEKADADYAAGRCTEL